MKRLAAVAAVFLLSGCAAVPMVAGGAVAGYFAAAQTINHDIDLANTAAQPLFRAICAVEVTKPHSDKVKTAIAVVCADLPSLESLAGRLRLAVEVAVLIEAEEAASK